MDPGEQAAVGRLSSMSLIAAVVAGGTPRVETQRAFVREVERVGRDPIHWVRREASFVLGALAKVVLDELIISSLLPFFESLRADPAWHAYDDQSLSLLFFFCREMNLLQSELGFWRLLGIDSNFPPQERYAHPTRRSPLQILSKALGEGRAREEVITGLLTVWEEGWLRNWRAHEGVIKIITDLSGGPERPDSICTLLRIALEDNFGAVRETAISVICRIAPQDIWRHTFNMVNEDMLSLANSPIFRRRMTFVACQQALASSAGGLSILVDDARWHALERLSNDSIVGVHIGVARLAGSILENALRDTSGVPWRIFDMIDHLQQDSSAEKPPAVSPMATGRMFGWISLSLLTPLPPCLHLTLSITFCEPSPFLDLFRGSIEALSRCDAVALFLEGTSYTEPRIMQVKDAIIRFFNLLILRTPSCPHFHFRQPYLHLTQSLRSRRFILLARPFDQSRSTVPLPALVLQVGEDWCRKLVVKIALIARRESDAPATKILLAADKEFGEPDIATALGSGRVQDPT
ncbi:hypothetical protein EDB19DRAFT_1906728 [Suillus lakei]|nr:hypothetical protein EDB19DRAFT_1906728 [Suillus lakei]